MSAAAAALTGLERSLSIPRASELLRRSGEFAKLWFRIQLEDSRLSLPCATNEHTELIGTGPTADERFWAAAKYKYERTSLERKAGPGGPIDDHPF